MHRTLDLQYVPLGIAVAALLLAQSGSIRAQATVAGQTVRQIPGITAKDAFPNGCVDCHTTSTKGGDARMSARLTEWAKTVPEPLAAKARAAAVDPAKIKGKHPPVPKPGANVPQGCLTVCHKKGSIIAPPFAALVHSIHYTGSPNPFLTQHQGECTHCHKLDAKTGGWKLPSAAEK